METLVDCVAEKLLHGSEVEGFEVLFMDVDGEALGQWETDD